MVFNSMVLSIGGRGCLCLPPALPPLPQEGRWQSAREGHQVCQGALLGPWQSLSDRVPSPKLPRACWCRLHADAVTNVWAGPCAHGMLAKAKDTW